MKDNEPIRIELSKSEALVLFDWLSEHFESNDYEFTPEEIALSRLLGKIEKILVEPFQPDYGEALSEARETLTRKYGSA
jgi:hypothetical protein